MPLLPAWHGLCVLGHSSVRGRGSGSDGALRSLRHVFLSFIALPLAGLLPATIVPAEAAPFILPPTITAPPANESVTVGSTATFTVGAGGSEPRQFQWERNGIPIGGATAA